MDVLPLPAGRSTMLYRNQTETRKLYVIPEEASEYDDVRAIYVILDNGIAPVNHMGMRSMEGFLIMIPPNSPYMVINTSESDFRVETDLEWKDQPILYNPYLFENEEHQTVDSAEIIRNFTIPEGYSDILAKWYSIKFSYPDYNYIFLRPGLGISLQTHQLREEYWQILSGNPIVIHGSKVQYDCPPESEFQISLGSKHTVINPSATDWVLLKETYTGTFDELDIVRLFNPNHYVE
ncbi:MAG: hypothetical protein ACTSYI_03690 [Promethearchaeota archaeon]